MHFDVLSFVWVYGCDVMAYWANYTDARCYKEFFRFVCVCMCWNSLHSSRYLLHFGL